MDPGLRYMRSPATIQRSGAMENQKYYAAPDKWRLNMAGGRFINKTEAGYTPIEGELLGIATALHKSRYFTSGQVDL